MTGPPDSAPASARRLFAHYDEAVLGKIDRSFVVGRLLEEGERADLAWLLAQVGEQQLGAWATGPGTRQLSRRSRAFWSVVLDLEPPVDEENPLWLL
jgi:hypothetical protein